MYISDSKSAPINASSASSIPLPSDHRLSLRPTDSLYVPPSDQHFTCQRLPMSLFHTERVGSGSGEVGCSIFYLCRSIGGAVLIRKTEVEETQFQSAFQSRIPSSRALVSREQILAHRAPLATVFLPEIRPYIRCSLHLSRCRSPCRGPCRGEV